MWHPFRKRALKRKTRAKDAFAREIGESLAETLDMQDMGGRLLALRQIQEAIDEHLQDETNSVNEKADAKAVRRGAAGSMGGFFGGLTVVAALHLPFTWPIVAGYVATVSGSTMGGLALGSRAQQRYRKRREAENEPFQARLEAIRMKATAAIEEALAGDLRDIATSPVFREVLERLPEARDAFAAAAVKAATSDPKTPPPPKANPGTGLNL